MAAKKIAKKKTKQAAKKAAAKSVKTKQAASRTSAASPQVESKAVVRELRTLNGRLADLMSMTLEMDDVARARARFAPADIQKDVLLGVEAKQVQVTFKKTSGPDFVTIKMLDASEMVLQPSQSEGTSAPRNPRDEIDVAIVVKGNFDQKAVIELTNAIPPVIEMSAFPGETGNQGTRRIVVVG